MSLENSAVRAGANGRTSATVERTEPTDFYDVRNLTRFGPTTIPGYAMVQGRVKPRQVDSWVNPGPGDYYPENYEPLGRRGPAFSLGGRLEPPKNEM